MRDFIITSSVRLGNIEIGYDVRGIPGLTATGSFYLRGEPTSETVEIATLIVELDGDETISDMEILLTEEFNSIYKHSPEGFKENK